MANGENVRIPPPSFEGPRPEAPPCGGASNNGPPQDEGRTLLRIPLNRRARLAQPPGDLFRFTPHADLRIQRMGLATA